MKFKQKFDAAIRRAFQEHQHQIVDEFREHIATWDGSVFNAIKLGRESSVSIGGQFTKGPYPQTRQEESEMHSFTCSWCGTHDTTRNLRGQLECCGCAHPVKLQKQNQNTHYAPVVKFNLNVRENFTDEETALAMRSILNEL